MSQEQAAALIAKLKDDAGLLEKLKCAADLDAVLEIAQKAGFDVCMADLLKFQLKPTEELSDESLAGLAGGLYGNLSNTDCIHLVGVGLLLV